MGIQECDAIDLENPEDLLCFPGLKVELKNLYLSNPLVADDVMLRNVMGKDGINLDLARHELEQDHQERISTTQTTMHQATLSRDYCGLIRPVDDELSGPCVMVMEPISSSTEKPESTEREDVLFSIISPLGNIVNVYDSCVVGSCSCKYSIGGVSSHLKPCRFGSFVLGKSEDFMARYLDLLWGVTDGFPIVDSEPPPYECENYSSITASGPYEKMSKILRKELEEGFVTEVDEKPCCVHSLGAVPKGENGIRNITDCSRPVGLSVNNHCESMLGNFCFKNVGNVVEMLEEGSFMSVIDIKAAYRAVPIREAHRKFQGFSWVINGKKCWFVDNRLCFGLRLGPKYFNLVSNFVHDVLVSVYNLKIVNYLDDFITIADTFQECSEARDTVVKLLRFLGFHVAYEKLVSPSQIVTYLGIIIDSTRMELRLPEGKLVKLVKQLDCLENKNRVSKKDLESLGGLLSHCSHIIRGGKIFCKNVYKLYKELISRNLRYIRLTPRVKDDLRWWRKFCRYFNGSMKMIENVYEFPMVSDSSFKGFAVYLNEDWAAGVWSDDDFIGVVSPCQHIVSKPLLERFESDNINVLELWPIVVGLRRWAPYLKNRSLIVFTDNTQVMFMLLNGGSVNECCCNWIREIFWLTAIYNIDLIPKYINTKSNLVADTLSRVAYPQTSKRVVEFLLGSNLCCLDLLFGFCRNDQQTGARREGGSLP